MLYLRLAWRNLWRNRRRTIITASAVFFAGFAVICMRMLQLGTYDLMVRNVVGTHEGFIQIHKKGYWDEQTLDNSFEMDESLVETVESVPGVAGVSPRLSSFSLSSEGLHSRPVQVEGFDFQRETVMSFKTGNFSNQSDNGAGYPGDGVIIGSDLADFLKVDIGDSIVFIGQGYHGQSAPALQPVTGIANLSNPILNKGTVFMDLAMSQYIYAADNRITALAINIDPDEDLAALTEAIRSKVDTSVYEVMNWQEMMPELVQTIQADSAGGILMAGILYIVISFSLLGTFIMLAAERKREYGMLVGLGMRKRQLMVVAFLEAFFMALLGSIAAILITRPIGVYYHYNPIQLTGQAMDAMREMGMDASMQASMDWSIPLVHSAGLLFLTLVISCYGLIVISKLKPVTAMRS